MVVFSAALLEMTRFAFRAFSRASSQSRTSRASAPPRSGGAQSGQPWLSCDMPYLATIGLVYFGAALRSLDAGAGLPPATLASSSSSSSSGGVSATTEY